METIKVNNDIIQPLQESWGDTYHHFQNRTQTIPTVAAGVVSTESALAWLKTASKIHPLNSVDRLIHQVSGLGAKDIRTLIAHDRKEYFPEDSPNELYERKRLSIVATPNSPVLEREKILTNVARAMLLKQYDLDRNFELEKKMATIDPSRKAEWLIGNPGLVAQKGKDNFLFDIQFTSNTNEVDQGDLVRLHYYDLVANTITQQPKHLSLAKVYIEPSFADAIILMAKTSKNSEKLLTQMAADFSSLSDNKIKVQVHQIEKKPDLYKEILSVGQKHWQQIISGSTPQINTDPYLKLDSQGEELYINKAKAFLAATQTVKAAESARKETIEDFLKSVSGLDISDNFIPPYTGALIRKYDYLDAESAARYFEENLGIDPVHLREQGVNVEMLKQAFVRMGGDLSPFYEYGAPDKKSIETVAEQVDFDLSGFYTRQMRPIVNPKTRGPVHDAIKTIRDSLANPIKELNAKTAQSNAMDNRNLLPAQQPSSTKQTTMKI
tara:strand:+ start:35308 stop:36795 length:1488 start_codon:yes stop_codon:yes gene_type:complete